MNELPPERGAEGEPESTARAVNELRRYTGLTWEHIATMLQTDRRSVRMWANGNLLDASDEERLRVALAAIKTADRGSAASNHAMLLPDRAGVVPFDLLARGEYGLFIEHVGVGHGRRDVKLAPLSPEAQAVRRPPPPDHLVGALQDSVHAEDGRLISATRIRRRRVTEHSNDHHPDPGAVRAAALAHMRHRRASGEPGVRTLAALAAELSWPVQTLRARLSPPALAGSRRLKRWMVGAIARAAGMDADALWRAGGDA